MELICAVHQYYEGDQIDAMGVNVRIGEMGTCNILVENSKGKRPVRRFRRRWEDNIKIDLKNM
jgi:hypothetical protein